MTTPSLTNPNPKREDERDTKTGVSIETRAREMLAAEYAAYVGEGPYPSYVDLALNGSGSFTLCSIRAIAKALATSALASARPSPGDPVRAAESIVWTPSTVKPDVGRKIVCLYDDGSGAALFYTHDHGVIDSDGDEYAALTSDYSLWAYLPDDFELHCELHSEPGEHPMHLPVVRAALSVSTPTGEGEAIARALSEADWPDVSIGNKALIQAAIQALRRPAALAHPQQGGERDEEHKALKKAELALKPFADRVYNDNGDISVTDTFRCGLDEFTAAYFAHRTCVAALATAPTSASKSSGEEA